MSNILDKMTLKYGLKAAPVFSQMADCIRQFEELKMSPFIELHLTEDMLSDPACRKVCGEFVSEYSVHIPQFFSGRFYDPKRQGIEPVLRTVEFAKEVGSNKMIVHRIFDSGTVSERKFAEKGFEKFILELHSKIGGDFTIFVENYGTGWFFKSGEKKYCVSKLDNFFPWEICRFREFLSDNGIKNIQPMLDVAHATLSSNLLNLALNKKVPVSALFDSLEKEDLLLKGVLSVNEFISAMKPKYLHICDAFTYPSKDLKSKEGITAQELEHYAEVDNLPLGSGNIDYKRLLPRISELNPRLIMEINPPDGNYDDKSAQKAAVMRLESFG